MSFEDKKTKGTVTIGYVVASVMNRLRDYSMRNYSFLEQIVIEGFTELNMFHLDNIEVVYLRMSSAKTVSVPCDFIDWLKIGIPINGRLRVITKDDSLLLPRTFADGKEVGNKDAVSVSSSDYLYFPIHYKDGSLVAGLYGLPGGIDSTYYRYDKEKRQFIFGGSIPRTEIVLEYLSTGVKLGGNTIIPREAVPALRAYALWQLIENDRKVPMGEKERKKQQYEEEVEKLRFFISAFTLEEYKQMVYKHARQSPKR